ncbi:MAG TPA: helix-turn-helix domain-containing protein, partial [Chloroflexota bacterium]|nr:helix-turn-helix domain-containing protein [Chloroflexota bacterium]
MDERMAFVAEYRQGEAGMAALCRQYGISRKTGYKWVARYEAEGVVGLANRSRAPQHHPQGVSEAVEEWVLGLRRAHPTWGPRK